LKRAWFLVGFALALAFLLDYFLDGKGLQQSQYMLKEKQEKNVLTVINSEKPQGPPVDLKFEEDLSIAKDFWDLRGIFIDNEDNIYTFANQAAFRKFSPEGVEMESKEFRKGQGPGEFQAPDPCFGPDRLLYVADTFQRRLTILNKSYETIKIQKLNFWGDILTLDSKGDMYFIVGHLLPGTRDKVRAVLTKYSSSVQFLHEVGAYEMGPSPDSSGLLHLSYFGPQMRYRIDSRDRVYYAMSNQYEIYVVSPEGQPMKKIIKKGIPRKITKKEMEKYNPNPKSGRVVVDMPEHVPFLADFFVFDNGFLLVVTYENGDDVPTLAGDLFDDQGTYRARVRVPKYHFWYWLFQLTKSHAVYKNDHFYTIETDRTGEKFFLKRYKMIWRLT
jgi:hypothetical protein